MCTGNCNCSCDQITIPSIAGPQGTNGLNAFTVTTAQFTVPAINSNVTLAVSNTNPNTGTWAIAGQSIYIQDAGYYEVVSSTATSIVAKNMGSIKNVAPGTVISTAKKVSPAGLTKNPGGVIAFDYFNEVAGTGSWQQFNSSNQEIDYEDYTLSINGDTINITTVIAGSPTVSSTTSLRLSFDGTILFTVPTSNIPPGLLSYVVFDVTLTRVSNTTFMFQGFYRVISSTTTQVYSVGSLSPVTIADLDSTGNYPLTVAPEVNSDIAWTLLTQTITSIKK